MRLLLLCVSPDVNHQAYLKSIWKCLINLECFPPFEAQRDLQVLIWVISHPSLSQIEAHGWIEILQWNIELITALQKEEMKYLIISIFNHSLTNKYILNLV